MDPSSQERWPEIERLLDQALDLAPEQRPAFLERTCSTDPELRAAVERLLQGTEAADSFLGEPAAMYAAPLVAWVAGRQELVPGTHFGAYEVVRRLGRGGMATVYLAQDHKHHRAVAIKVLHPELAAAVGPERFLREIEIAAALHHPHILPLYDSGISDGLLYYAMPYIEGESLRQRLAREEQLRIEDALKIVQEVAGALDYAHRQGVVHRDIKPENILLQDGQAIVADFGIARAIDAAGSDTLAETDSLGTTRSLDAVGEPRLTEPGPGIGTPAYMSPEQASSDAVIDGRADIYALGCVLYEMLAGQTPFIGRSRRQILAGHAADPVPSLHMVRQTVPQALERAVTCALAKLPADRFPTGQAFAEALAAAPRPMRRQRALVAGMAVSVAALVFAVATRPPREQPVKVDRAMVAVAPFRVASADSSLGYLREGMVDLLAAKLSGTAMLRPADPRTLLSAWRRAASGAGDLPESRALPLAAQLGAGRLVTGEVVGGGPRLSISTALLDVPGGRILARAAVEGPPDSLSPLVDRLAAQLLALGAGEHERQIASFTGTSLPALRAYLDGQTLYRRGAYEDALRKFEEAFGADSTFALAALGIVRASFGSDFDPNHPGVQAAWRHRDRFSIRDRALLDVFLGPHYPAPRGSREFLDAAERLAQVAPDSPEAWFVYGALLVNYGALVGVADAPRRAMAAFGRTLALDSSYTEALSFLTEQAAAHRDTATMRRGLRLFRSIDSTSTASVALQWEVATALGDTTAAHRAARNDSMISTRADGWVNRGPWPMLLLILHEGLGLQDADLVFDRSLAAAPTESQRSNLLELQYKLEVMRGRPSRAQVPAWWSPDYRNAELVLNALFVDGDSGASAPATAALERGVGSPINSFIARYAAGQHALQSNRLKVARRALADFQAFRGSGSDSAAAAQEAGAYALILGAQIAARQWSLPAAEQRLHQLDSVLANPNPDEPAIFVFGNLIAARLHEGRGRLAAALAAVRRREWGSTMPPAYVTYHREEGRLAALSGDTAGAIRAYRRYLWIRGDAEPRLQPQVERVREELARLVSVTRSATNGRRHPPQ